MASSPPLLLLLLLLSSFLLFLLSPSAALRPSALVLPVTKDAATLQYVTRLRQRTPLVLTKLVVDLGGRFLWVNCDTTAYVSSSYRPARCLSAQCALANSDGCEISCFSAPRPGCNNNTCGVSPDNPITRTSTGGEVGNDVLAILSTDGSNPGPLATAPHILFSCAPTFLLKGLAAGVSGMAGLGRTKIGLGTQLAASFSFHKTFALCLSSSASADGVIFLGGGPYKFLPFNEISQSSLIYTPLIVNPVSTAGSYQKGEKSADYFIGVKSIMIGEKVVPLNTALLSIDRNGVGGTKISTVVPYTTLETSIYKAVLGAFAAALANVTRAAPVAPFGLCYSAKGIGSTRVGAAVPAVDLVLQSKSVYWRIFGANSMVGVSNDEVLCLGFVDGGVKPRTSIVIGGYQLEDNLLQFDLATSTLGFSSTLLFRQTTCANFNFTSNA